MLSIINDPGVRFDSILRMVRRAAGALEHALLVLFIAVGIIGGVTNLGAAMASFISSFAPIVAGLAS
ncbi:MAG: hypothetical protein ACJ8AI_33280 [Rhodopila sp.]